MRKLSRVKMLKVPRLVSGAAMAETQALWLLSSGSQLLTILYKMGNLKP